MIGTELLGRPAAHGPGLPWDEHVPLPGRDASLLAVVPIPGTRTSLVIVGYAITTSEAPGPAPDAPDPAPDAPEPGHFAPESGPAASQPQPAAEPASDLLVDHVQRRVWIDGAEVNLTFQEFELLAFLSAHPATVFSRADLVQRVWQRRFAADSRTVDVHVSRLRHKLGPAYGRCLVTEYRVGYMFRPPAG